MLSFLCDFWAFGCQQNQGETSSTFQLAWFRNRYETISVPIRVEKVKAWCRSPPSPPPPAPKKTQSLSCYVEDKSSFPSRCPPIFWSIAFLEGIELQQVHLRSIHQTIQSTSFFKSNSSYLKCGLLRTPYTSFWFSIYHSHTVVQTLSPNCLEKSQTKCKWTKKEHQLFSLNLTPLSKDGKGVRRQKLNGLVLLPVFLADAYLFVILRVHGLHPSIFNVSKWKFYPSWFDLLTSSSRRIRML